MPKILLYITFLTITDEAIITEWIKQTVIRFTDVQSFNVAKMGFQK